jgi:hypothetical protein
MEKWFDAPCRDVMSMNRKQFKLFVEQTIENVIRNAEQHIGQQLPHKYCFRWAFKGELFCEDVSEVITQAVYEDENHIRSSLTLSRPTCLTTVGS